MPTNVSIPNSSLPNSSTISIIQDLMEGFGWQNKSSEIYQADVEQAQAEQRLANAIQFYLEEQNNHTRARLMIALNETLQSAQAEYDHAVKQFQYHQKQAEIEAEQKAAGKPGYLSQWSYWIFDGVKNFFGSTTEQQVEKYQNLVSKHQITIEKLSDTLSTLHNEESENYVTTQRSENVSLAHFPSILKLSDLNGLTGFRINGEVISDKSGWSVKGGSDINGDGYDDLLIGATNVSNSSSDNYHQVARGYLIFGGTHTGNKGQLDLAALNGTNGFKLLQDGAVSNGISVSFAGDVNGDGYIDLIIGAPNFNADYHGQAFVLFGNKSLGKEGDINLLKLNGSNGFKIINSDDDCGIGYSVVGSGDINSDGYDDLLLGCENYNGRTLCGYGLFGGADIGKIGFINTKSLNGTEGFKLYCEEMMSEFNSVSGAEDINGDRYLDFLVSSPGFNSSEGGWTYVKGRTYTVFGGSQLGANGNLTLSNLNGTNGLKIDGEICSQSGVSIDGVGDINNDGYNDFLIGAPNINSEGCDGMSYSGRIYTVFGGPTLNSINNGLLNVSSLNGNNGFTIIGDKSFNGDAGYSLGRAKDVNGDNIQDIIIGSPLGCVREGCNYGQTYVIFGHSKLGDRGYLNLTDVDGIIGFKMDGDVNTVSGFSVSGAGDVNGDGVADLLIGAPNTFFGSSNPPPDPPPPPGHSYIVFGDIPPVLVNNTLNLYRSEQVLLNASHLAAFDRNHDNNSLIFVPTNITHGYFEDINQQSIHLSNFTQLQVKNQQIQFVHDGSFDPPTYEITVRSSGIAWTGPGVATIYFNPMPIVLVNNQLAINQSQTIILTTMNLLATCNLSSNLTFIITNITHGFFTVEKTTMHSSEISFPQQSVYAQKISFTQDGTPYAPIYYVSVNDVWAQTIPASANITFNSVPMYLVNNQLNTKQNVTTLLTSQELMASRSGYADPNFNFVITNITHGFFVVNQQKSSNQITFAQQAILTGNVGFTQDGSMNAPIYWVAVNDGWNQTNPQQANITFFTKPVFAVNQFLVALGQSVALSLNNLCVNDCYSDEADELQFNLVGNVTSGQFENISTSGAAITCFTQKNIKKNQIKFVSNGMPQAPRYKLTVTDPASLLSDSSDGSTLLVTKNYLPINQNQTFYPTAENLNITSSSGSTTDIILSPVTNTLKHGYFSLVSDISVPIVTFRQDQINKNQIAFVPDGSSDEPSCILSVRDSQSVASGSFPCQIDFASYPRLDHAFLKINPPDSIQLTASHLEASDDRVLPEQLYFMVSDVVNDHFAYSNNFNKPITNFTQAEISAGKIYFIATSNQPPAFTVTVWNGRLYCQEDCPRAATIVAPDVGNEGGINSLLIGLLSSFGTLVLLPLAKCYFEKAVKAYFSSREDTVDSQVTNEALAQLWIGCCGVITHRQHEAYIIAFGHVIDKLNESKQSVSLRKEWQNLGDRQKREIKSIIAEKSKEVLVGEQSRFCRFFKSFCGSEATPEIIERKAERIADKVAPCLTQLFSPVRTIPRAPSINNSASMPLLTGNGSGINLT